jgi:hypothetical protein
MPRQRYNESGLGFLEYIKAEFSQSAHAVRISRPQRQRSDHPRFPVALVGAAFGIQRSNQKSQCNIELHGAHVYDNFSW